MGSFCVRILLPHFPLYYSVAVGDSALLLLSVDPQKWSRTLPSSCSAMRKKKQKTKEALLQAMSEGPFQSFQKCLPLGKSTSLVLRFLVCNREKIQPSCAVRSLSSRVSAHPLPGLLRLVLFLLIMILVGSYFSHLPSMWPVYADYPHSLLQGKQLLPLKEKQESENHSFL